MFEGARSSGDRHPAAGTATLAADPVSPRLGRARPARRRGRGDAAHPAGRDRRSRRCSAIVLIPLERVVPLRPPSGAAARAGHRPHPPARERRAGRGGHARSSSWRWCSRCCRCAPSTSRASLPGVASGALLGVVALVGSYWGHRLTHQRAVPLAVPRRAPQHRAHGLDRGRAPPPDRLGRHPGVRHPAAGRARLRRRAGGRRSRSW